MNIPRLKQVLTDSDEFITNSQLKTLALEVLDLVPIPGIEGSPLDSGEIMEVVLRAAVGTTSVDHIENSLTPPVELESASSVCGQVSKRHGR
jgi:hypothetical protein